MGNESKINEEDNQIYDGKLNPFDCIAVTGSYLGSDSKLNAIKPITITNAEKINAIPSMHKSAEIIHKFNQNESKKYSKLRKSLNKKSKNKIANIWDRQYAAMCIAKNIPIDSIQFYANSMQQIEEKQNDKNKECDILLRCGGIYAMNPMKTSGF